MAEFFDVKTIVAIAVAAYVISRLYSVLGSRTGRDETDSRTRSRVGLPPEARHKGSASESGGKVIQLPETRGQAVPGRSSEGLNGEKRSSGSGRQRQSSEAHYDEELIVEKEELSPEDEALIRNNQSLSKMLTVDPSFRPTRFTKGTCIAYEQIITCFSKGDTAALKPLVSREVYASFSEAIRERGQRGETLETQFVSVDPCEIIQCELRSGRAFLTVRIHSQLITTTRNAQGEVIGDEDGKISSVTDVWTFTRDLKSPNPNWKLVTTDA